MYIFTNITRISKNQTPCLSVPAAVAWSLHRDLGFPLDLVDLMLEEKGIQVDRQELDQLMADYQKVKGVHQVSLRLL